MPQHIAREKSEKWTIYNTDSSVSPIKLKPMLLSKADVMQGPAMRGDEAD
jgi:hypothetical protein